MLRKVKKRWPDEDWEGIKVRKAGDRRRSEEANKGKTSRWEFSGEGSASMGTCNGRGIPSMDIPVHLPRPEVARLIPLEVARKLMAVPLAMEEEVLTVAMANPHDCESTETLARISGYRIFLVLSPLDQLEAALQRLEALCNGSPAHQPTREERQHAPH